MNSEVSRYKFRAWDKRRGKMIQPNGGDFIGWHAMKNWKDCLEVMQFTGLRDKNGKEIYEGDIVACIENKFGEGRHEYWEVVYGYFGDAAFYVSNQLNSGRLLEIADYSNSVVFSADGTEEITCEVIGNIFENPEMTRT